MMPATPISPATTPPTTTGVDTPPPLDAAAADGDGEAEMPEGAMLTRPVGTTGPGAVVGSEGWVTGLGLDGAWSGDYE